MSAKPTPAVDLDALLVEHDEKRAKDRAEPFVVEGVGPDKVAVTFADPEDLDWETAQDIAQAFERSDLREVFFDVIKDGDELNAWFEARVPGAVAGRVLRDWMAHHGWDMRRGRMNREERRAAKKR